MKKAQPDGVVGAARKGASVLNMLGYALKELEDATRRNLVVGLEEPNVPNSDIE